jgi:hypothetical protein
VRFAGDVGVESKPAGMTTARRSSARAALGRGARGPDRAATRPARRAWRRKTWTALLRIAIDWRPKRSAVAGV